MTLQEMAQRVMLAHRQGDLRYDEFVTKLAERTGLDRMQILFNVQMMAMGVGV